MNKFISKIAVALVGCAMAVGVGVAIGNNSDFRVAEATTSTTVVIDSDSLGLTSTATTGVTNPLYQSVEYCVSAGAKYTSTSQSNKFTAKCILIGKNGTYIYNSTPFFGDITKFEVYINGGSIAAFSFGINFSASPINAYNSSAANTYTRTVDSSGDKNTVLDLSSSLASGTRYFWYQVTNDKNSQVEFRVTYAKKSITSIGYTGTLTKANYIVGEKFDPSGLTFNVVSSDGNESINAKAITWSNLTAGMTSVTGTFLGSNVTVTGITVSAPKNLTVTYDPNGADSGNVPTDSNSPYANTDEVTVLGNTGSLVKAGYRFGGWNTASDDTGDAYLPSETFNISANTTLHARWLNNNQITFGDKSLELENGVQYSDPFETDLFNIQFAGGGNDGKYYTSGAGIKTYSNGTITISVANSLTTKELTSIVFVWATAPAEANLSSVSTGEYDLDSKTWTGKAKSVVLTRSSTAGDPNSWQLKKVTVTLGDIAASSVSISLDENSDSTLNDGNIVIEKDAGSGSYVEYLKATVTPNNAADKTVTWSATGTNASFADIANATIDDANNKIQFTIDTSNVGTFTINASADGGDATDSIVYTIYNPSATEYDVSVTATNGSFLPANPKIRENDSLTLTFSANDGYKLPQLSSAFIVTNATLTSWTPGTGELIISNPEDDVEVSVAMVELSNYTITVSATNCTYTGVTSGVTQIREDGTATITFTPDSGYKLPASVSISGASQQSWSNGVLVINNPTAAVSITVTATSFDNTFNIVNGGQYKIYHTINDVKYYLVQKGDSSAPLATANSWEATIFTFNLVGDDTFTITESTNTFYCDSSNNGLRYGEGETTWLITAGTHYDTSEKQAVSSGTGHYNIKATNYNRYISAYIPNQQVVPQDFRSWLFNAGGDTYNAGRTSSTQLELYDAEAFAQDVVNATNTVCSSGYDNAASDFTTADVGKTPIWTNLASNYSHLPAAQKTILVEATYTREGSTVTRTGTTTQVVAEGVARQDYLVGKYGLSNLLPGREVPSLSKITAFANTFASESNNTILIIVAISTISALAVGGYFFIRRRKER